jgi:hypothetical protein
MNFIPAVASVRPKCSTSRGLRWLRSSLPVIPHSLITTTPLGGDEKFNQMVASAPWKPVSGNVDTSADSEAFSRVDSDGPKLVGTKFAACPHRIE